MLLLLLLDVILIRECSSVTKVTLTIVPAVVLAVDFKSVRLLRELER